MCCTGNACGNGDVCCDSCQFSPRTKACRPAASDCDVTEYCSGTSSTCAADQFVGPGNACTDSAARPGLCYSGECRSFAAQCSERNFTACPINFQYQLNNNLPCNRVHQYAFFFLFFFLCAFSQFFLIFFCCRQLYCAIPSASGTPQGCYSFTVDGETLTVRGTTAGYFHLSSLCARRRSMTSLHAVRRLDRWCGMCVCRCIGLGSVLQWSMPTLGPTQR